MGTIRMIDDHEKIKKLAKTLSLNERLILENQHIHKTLFSFIRWTQEEERETQNGLFIKTLELKPPQEKAFKLFRNWQVINTLGKLGIPKAVAKDSAKLYQSSGAFGILLIDNEADEAFITAGRLFQRLWLYATRLQLALQPVTALLYLGQRINAGDTEKFSHTHAQLITKANQTINTLFGITNEVPVMLFRVGSSEPPSAVSLKREPTIHYA